MRKNIQSKLNKIEFRYFPQTKFLKIPIFLGQPTNVITLKQFEKHLELKIHTLAQHCQLMPVPV